MPKSALDPFEINKIINKKARKNLKKILIYQNHASSNCFDTK